MIKVSSSGQRVGRSDHVDDRRGVYIRNSRWVRLEGSVQRELQPKQMRDMYLGLVEGNNGRETVRRHAKTARLITPVQVERMREKSSGWASST